MTKQPGRSAGKRAEVAASPPICADGASGKWIRAGLDYLLLAPAALPLLYVPGFFFPYFAPKTLALRSLAVLALAALSWLMLGRSELYLDRLKQRVAWIPAALLVVMYATSLTGMGLRHSFWSTFERGDGLLTFSVVVVFFYAMLLRADQGFMRRLAGISMWVGSLVALIACFQWLQLPDRVGSTLGNAAYMASYLGMTLFLSLWLAREFRGQWRWLALLGAGLQLLAIVVLSATRGTILALGIAGTIAAAFAAWKLTGRARLLARVWLAAVALLVTLFFAFRPQLANVPFVPLQRLATMSPTSDTGAARLLLWERLGREALHQPFTGVGAEHVEDVYNRIYQPYRVAEWVDRSHNAYLDYFVQYGLFGALLYLALLVAALRVAYSVFKAGSATGGYCLLLFVTCAVQNFFVFDIALTLWLFLAVLAALLADAKSVARPLRIPLIPAAARALPSLALVALLVPVAVQPARANLLLMKAFNWSVTDVNRSAAALKDGMALRTYADIEYGYNAYQMYANAQVTQLNGQPRLLGYQATLDILRRNFERYPYDARTAAYLAHVLDLTPPEAAPDMALLNAAIDRAIRLSPGHVEPWYFRANIAIRMGDAAGTGAEKNAHYTAAINTLTAYTAKWPERADTFYVIAGLYLAMGDVEQARTWADAGNAAFPLRQDPYAARKAFRYYIKASQWAKATQYLEFIVAGNPQEYETALVLAKTKFLAGDKRGARAIVDQLRAASPGTLATDPDFIAQVRASQD